MSESERDYKAERAYYRAQEKADKTGRKVWFQHSKGRGWWILPKRKLGS